MGTDTPLACLSDKPQPLFNYFKQLFAQVTNPPIDPIREEMVMSLTSYIGTERNILDETPQHCHTLKLPHPILTNRDLEKLRRVSQGDFLATTLPTLFPVDDGEKGLERALDAALPARVAGHQIRLHAADPLRSRRRSGLRAHSQPAGADGGAQPPGPRGDAHAGRADHRIRRAARGHALRAADRLRRQRDQSVPGDRDAGRHGQRGSCPNGHFDKALKNYKKAINKGLLKTFSKMGISTLQSYRGAQVFEAIGLNKQLVDKYFTGTASRIEGVGLDVLAREAATEARPRLPPRHRVRYRTGRRRQLSVPRARRVSSASIRRPSAKLQHAVRQESFADVPGVHAT